MTLLMPLCAAALSLIASRAEACSSAGIIEDSGTLIMLGSSFLIFIASKAEEISRSKFRDFLLLLVKLKRHIVRIPRGWWGRLVLFMSGVECGSGLKMTSAPFIKKHFTARIILGDNVNINNVLDENPAGIAHKTVLAATARGSEIIIGDNVGISGTIIYAWKKIAIGDNTQVGVGTKIYDTDFHMPGLKGSMDDVKSAPVIIGKNVWIGADCKILKGVTIGDGAVIAAGSVVTRDVEPYIVAGGVPARALRRWEKKAA